MSIPTSVNPLNESKFETLSYFYLESHRLDKRKWICLSVSSI